MKKSRWVEESGWSAVTRTAHPMFLVMPTSPSWARKGRGGKKRRIEA
jgi:hypothetical protein